MLKRTLLFVNPVRIRTKNEQLIIQLENETQPIPIEDVGYIVLDNAEIYISPPAIEKCLQYNVAIVYCDSKHLPCGMLLNLEANTLQQERFEAQIQTSEPLKKQLWKQIVEAKILNQALLLEKIGQKAEVLFQKSKQVQSGDTTQQEAQAARIYWANLFPKEIAFYRARTGNPPNHLLNYGYAIIRAAMARALAGAGLLATLGLHHHNRYNAFCLADDMMEPYRPWVDRAVCELVGSGEDYQAINKTHKIRLLNVLAEDSELKNETIPLMNAMQTSAVSLVKCFMGKSRKLVFPTIF
ncbi:MAG: type II CRISPR-associated endonuclease Cas1 [Microscillaceae bacterium]|nr:type II CRISPR-associated endonuclease Cas1 [Microscillaceae bacterium]MDW8459872.1 type II CRISPR-associated endonuclease Cas1 [Cytophagales bacterium]